MAPDTLEFIGMRFDNLSVEQVVAELLERPRAAHFAYLVTPNTDHLMRLKRQPELRRYYDAAWLCVLDSRCLGRLAGLLRLPMPAVSPGADIVEHLLSNLTPQNIAVIGMSHPSLRQLQSNYPKLRFIHHEPPADLINNEIALRRARDFAVQTNARFTFIALGSPVQEVLAFEIARQPAAIGTGLCIGSALLYCSGTLSRAPEAMRRNGLEWLHRLAHNPRRLWRRYLLDDPPVIWELIKEKFARSRLGQPLPAAPGAISAPDPYPPEQNAHLQKTPDEP